MIYAYTACVLCAALGWMAHWSFNRAANDFRKESHRRECAEYKEEIARLRAQVAKWIGT